MVLTDGVTELVVILTLSCIHRWQQFLTTGDPPLGVEGYALCSIDRTIYFFGGCSSNGVYQNSLYSLKVDKWKWNVLFSTSQSNGPMKKGYTGMIAFHESLLVVGGYGPPPKNPQPSAKYNGNAIGGGVRTDEHHMYGLLTGELINCICMHSSGDEECCDGN